MIRTQHDLDLIWIEVEADGFLYNMVRNIVGALETIGSGKNDSAWLQTVLAKQDRRAAAATAPPQGLFLLRVEYEEPQVGLEPEATEQGGGQAGANQ